MNYNLDEKIEFDKLIRCLFFEENFNFSSEIIEKNRVINFVPFHDDLNALKNEQQEISLKHTKAMFEINKHFQEKNIPLIHLKGPCLSFRIYQNFTKRCYVDLDILIQEKDIEIVVLQLKSLNYHIKGSIFNTEKQKKTLLNNFHHLTFYNAETNCFVEVHWKLAASRFISKTFQNEVWDSIKFFVFGKNELCVLDEVDEYIYLCIHGSRHNFDRLNWLLDLKKILQLYDDTFLEKVIAKSDKYLLSVYVFHALYLLKYFDPNFQIPLHNFNSKSKKLSKKSMKKLQTKNKKRLIINYIEYYHAIYVTNGLKGVFQEWKTRNIKPENWSFLYFPDKIFFLNQFFSRPIWILRKIIKNK